VFVSYTFEVIIEGDLINKQFQYIFLTVHGEKLAMKKEGKLKIPILLT
jgi:hypothetical protein